MFHGHPPAAILQAVVSVSSLHRPDCHFGAGVGFQEALSICPLLRSTRHRLRHYDVGCPRGITNYFYIIVSSLQRYFSEMDWWAVVRRWPEVGQDNSKLRGKIIPTICWLLDVDVIPVIRSNLTPFNGSRFIPLASHHYHHHHHHFPFRRTLTEGLACPSSCSSTAL